MNQYLALTILAESQPDTLSLLMKFLTSHRAEIESTRMLTIGNEIAMLVLVKAAWNELAKLETQLPHFAAQHQLMIQAKRTEAKQYEPKKWIPYSAEFITRDATSLVETVSTFFLEAGAVVHAINDNRYVANPVGVPMYSLSMRILLPADTLLSDLREQFITLADFLNIDAYLEPERS